MRRLREEATYESELIEHLETFPMRTRFRSAAEIAESHIHHDRTLGRFGRPISSVVPAYDGMTCQTWASTGACMEGKQTSFIASFALFIFNFMCGIAGPAP